MENKISIEIPETVAAEVLKKFEEINQLMSPYLVTIPDDEKSALLRLGDKTIPFVDKTNNYTSSAPEFVPAFMDTAEFRKDTKAVKIMDEMYRAGNQVMRGIDDTRCLLGNDAYSGSLIYYTAVKSAAKAGVAKAKSIYEDLANRFPGRPRKSGKE